MWGVNTYPYFRYLFVAPKSKAPGVGLQSGLVSFSFSRIIKTLAEYRAHIW